MTIDPKHLPEDPQILQQLVLELLAKLDRESSERTKLEDMLRELLDAKRGRKSEQLSDDQLVLFEAAWQQRNQQPKVPSAGEESNQPGEADNKDNKKRSGRQPLPAHLKRERIVHDLVEAEKHCNGCGKDLRPIGEETSERLEYIPASLVVIVDACLKYACDCTVRTAGKPAQPIEKSNAGASLLAQVIVSKFADHLPLNRQQEIFSRHGADVSRKTMGGWMGQTADLLTPLYDSLKGFVLSSKVVGTDDTSVKVLDRQLEHTRTGRFWPYCGDRYHRAIIYDYTPTRQRAGPEQFLKGYKGYIQADAYGAYDAFFIKPGRGLIEVGCWAHTRRYFHKALETDQARMGPALHLIGELYKVEDQARSFTVDERLGLRQSMSRPVLDELRKYLLEIQFELLPKSPARQAVRYALKNWIALNRFCEDGILEIDNNYTERSIRGIAVGRNNWTFLGSDNGGRTAAVLNSFVASCKLIKVDPFAYLKAVLSCIATHPINRLSELLPHNWAVAQTPA